MKDDGRDVDVAVETDYGADGNFADVIIEAGLRRQMRVRRGLESAIASAG